MTTQEGNNAVVARHLEALANAAKEYTLAELANISVSGESCTLPTASTTTKGGVKIGNGLQMDGDTLNVTIQSGSAGATVLDTVPATVDGGLWYEMFNDKPVLKIRKGDYNYVFEHSRIQRATANEYLVAWLRFNQSTTFDECGIHTWEAVGSPTIGAANSFNGYALQATSDGYVRCTDGIKLGLRDFTIDCWAYFDGTEANYSEFAYFVHALNEDSQRLFMGINTTAFSAGVNGEYWSVEGRKYHTLKDPTLRIFNDSGYITYRANSVEYAERYFTQRLVHGALVYKHDRRRWYVFVNGICINTNTTNLFESAVTYEFVGIGKGRDDATKFTGAISEFRIHDGVALWTENFTPPTASDYS